MKRKITIASIILLISVIVALGIVCFINVNENMEKNTKTSIYQATEKRAVAGTARTVETWDISATAQDKVTATLYENGTLEITGNGNMKEWLNVIDVPWCSKRSTIKTLRVGDSITSIGNSAFYGCENLTILCKAGSKAEEYAKANNIKYKIVEKIIKSIEIKTKPTKTDYYVGETLDTEGLTIEVKYDNGTSETVQKGFTCTPTKLTKETKEIKVNYEGQIATFAVNVTEKQINNDNNNEDNNDNKDDNNNEDNNDNNGGNNNNSNSGNGQNTQGGSTQKGSSTTTNKQVVQSPQGNNIATKILPKTGTGITMLIGVLASSVVAIVSWIKFKKYRNI